MAPESVNRSKPPDPSERNTLYPLTPNAVDAVQFSWTLCVGAVVAESPVGAAGTRGSTVNTAASENGFVPVVKLAAKTLWNGTESAVIPSSFKWKTREPEKAATDTPLNTRTKLPVRFSRHT